MDELRKMKRASAMKRLADKLVGEMDLSPIQKLAEASDAEKSMVGGVSPEGGGGFSIEKTSVDLSPLDKLKQRGRAERDLIKSGMRGLRGTRGR